MTPEDALDAVCHGLRLGHQYENPATKPGRDLLAKARERNREADAVEQCQHVREVELRDGKLVTTPII